MKTSSKKTLARNTGSVTNMFKQLIMLFQNVLSQQKLNTLTGTTWQLLLSTGVSIEWYNFEASQIYSEHKPPSAFDRQKATIF